MAFLMEQAGGLATNGKIDILDIDPKGIHDRSPIFIGSKEDVEEVMSVIKKYENWECKQPVYNFLRAESIILSS